MKRTNVARGWRALAVMVCLPLAFALGCATSGSRREQEAALRKAQSRLEIGIDHAKNGRMALGLREFLAAEKLDPGDPNIQRAIGEAYRRKGKLAESELHLKRALEIYPEYHDARLNLTALYVQAERYEEVVAECELLLDDPTFPAPWRGLTQQGWAELKLGRLVDARKSLELARDYSPTYWKTLLNLGILEAQEGHRLEAIGLLESVIEGEPGSFAEAEANYRLAEIYVSLGKRRRAVRHLVSAAAQTPSGKWGRKSEEYLKLLR